jgi:hypothetical protein
MLQTLERYAIIQAILDRVKGQVYVEIGVGEGEGFWRINASRKIAIDPKPGLTVTAKVQRVVFKTWWQHRIQDLMRGPILPQLAKTTLFHMTSDEFFSRYAWLFTGHKIDVAFIDGLHTYRQSLRDVHNCLDHLNPHGVIVLHDCSPPSEVIAVPAPSFDAAVQMNLSGWDGRWCGDVWKTIVHLRMSREDLQVFVLDCDLGVGIVTRGKAEHPLSSSVREIEALSYQDLSKDRAWLLNVKAPTYLDEFLAGKMVPVLFSEGHQ